MTSGVPHIYLLRQTPFLRHSVAAFAPSSIEVT
jgi:hypothetical protein